MKKTANNEYLHLLKVFGDKARFNIVILLSAGDKCVCDIFEELNLKQSIVSHHLSVLRKSGLVKIEREGKWIYYSLNKKRLLKLQKFIKELINTKKNNNKCK